MTIQCTGRKAECVKDSDLVLNPGLASSVDPQASYLFQASIKPWTALKTDYSDSFSVQENF